MSPITLTKQAHLSLNQRAEIIRGRFNLPSFTGRSLLNYYSRNVVRFIKPRFAYLRKKTNLDGIKQLQYQCSLSIAEHMRDEHELVYIDETTFHLWMKPTRVWASPGMHLHIPNNRGRSLTVIGAISAQNGLLHFELIEGTPNGETFRRFLGTLKGTLAR